MEHNKLVRDRIPEIIEKSRRTAVTRVLDDAEYARCLEKKLDEEVAEFHRDQNIEELADILEVVLALCSAKGHTVKELETAYRKKHESRGGFERKIYLVRTEDNE